MLGLFRRDASRTVIDRLHGAVVEASRRPELYGSGGLPDTVEGRFESLALHAMLVLRRLRHLPAPAGDVAQDLVDTLFSYLEIAVRESGVGDFGVPKRMKKILGAFYDRGRVYDPLLDGSDADGLAAEIAARLERPGDRFDRVVRYVLASETALAGQSLDAILAGPRFAAAPAEGDRS